MMVQMKYGNLTAEVVCKSLANLQSWDENSVMDYMIWSELNFTEKKKKKKKWK